MNSIRALITLWILALLGILLAGFGGTEPWAESMFIVSSCILSAAMLTRFYRADSELLGIPVAAAPFCCIALIGAAQLAFGASIYPHVTSLETVRYGAYAALAFSTADVASDVQIRRFLLDALYLLGIGVCLFGIVHVYTCEGRLLWFMTNEFGPTLAPFINRDHYAAFCELVLPFALCRSLRSKKRPVLHGLAAALVVSGLIVSGSRAGIAIGAIELAVLLTLHVNRIESRVRLSVIAVSIVAIGIVFATVPGPDFLIKKARAPAEWQYRLMMANSAWHLGLDRPFTGHGLGTFELTYPRYAKFDLGLRVDHAHNELLEWFAEGGLVVPLCMAAFALSSLRRCREQLWLFGVPAVLLHGVVDFPWRIPAIAAYSIVIAAAAQPLRFAASSNTRVKKSRDVGEQPTCNVPLFGDSSTNPR